MHELIIRSSKKEDFSQLVAMDNSLWNGANSPSNIRWDSEEQYAFGFPEGSQLVAVWGEIVCGYAELHQPTPLETNQHVAEISLAVHPNYRRHGIGRRLLEAVCEKAREQKKHKISLRVLAVNEGAIRLYKACGFREQGCLKDEFLIDGNYVDDVLMYKMID